ncbi:MAG: hypothetical protein U0W40_15180 [Acidimicrobiia bacterium]
MSGTVLHGEWKKLHRRGARIWLRERPHEVVWPTTAECTVDEIRSIEIQPLRVEVNRRRRMAVGNSSKVVRPARTRVTIDHGADAPLVVDLVEPEDRVRATFADLAAVMVEPPTIDLVAEHAADDTDDSLPWISWRAAGETGDADPAPAPPTPTTLVQAAQQVDTDLAREVSFKLELGEHPEAVGRWRDTVVTDSPDPTADDHADALFGEVDGPGDAPTNGAWVRKRRKRPIHQRVRSG